MAKKKELTFEENLEKLETIVEKLESGDLPLEKAFDYYKEGMDLSLSCSKELEEVEKEVTKIEKKYDGDVQLSPFNLEGDN